MKKSKFILGIVFLMSFVFCHSQDLKGLSQESSMTYFGVDYSQSLFIGKKGFNDIEKIAEYFPNQWNTLFLKESEKYGINKYLDKEAVENSLGVVNAINDKMTKEDVEARLEDSFEKEDELTIEKAIELSLSYNLKSTNNKYGAIFFAVKMSKLHTRAKYIMIVLNLENNSVAYAKDFIGTAGGFGFRNYWAGSFYSGLKSLKKSYKKDIKKNKL